MAGKLSAETYSPKEVELEKKSRPDSAAFMREAHQAKSYLAWTQEKAEASLADPAPNVGHDQVMAEAKAIIDAKRSRHAATT